MFAGGLGGVIGVALFAGLLVREDAASHGQSALSLFQRSFPFAAGATASYRDMRFIPTDLKHQLLFPLLFSVDWGVADDLPFEDIRVGLAYVLVILTLPLWFFGSAIARR